MSTTDLGNAVLTLTALYGNNVRKTFSVRSIHEAIQLSKQIVQNDIAVLRTLDLRGPSKLFQDPDDSNHDYLVPERSPVSDPGIYRAYKEGYSAVGIQLEQIPLQDQESVLEVFYRRVKRFGLQLGIFERLREIHEMGSKHHNAAAAGRLANEASLYISQNLFTDMEL